MRQAGVVKRTIETMNRKTRVSQERKQMDIRLELNGQEGMLQGIYAKLGQPAAKPQTPSPNAKIQVVDTL